MSGVKLVLAGHLRALNEDGDNRDVTLQRGCRLDPDKISGVVQPAAPTFVDGIDPLTADDHDKRIARRDSALE